MLLTLPCPPTGIRVQTPFLCLSPITGVLGQLLQRPPNHFLPPSRLLSQNGCRYFDKTAINTGWSQTGFKKCIAAYLSFAEPGSIVPSRQLSVYSESNGLFYTPLIWNLGSAPCKISLDSTKPDIAAPALSNENCLICHIRNVRLCMNRRPTHYFSRLVS